MAVFLGAIAACLVGVASVSVAFGEDALTFRGWFGRVRGSVALVGIAGVRLVSVTPPGDTSRTVKHLRLDLRSGEYEDLVAHHVVAQWLSQRGVEVPSVEGWTETDLRGGPLRS